MSKSGEALALGRAAYERRAWADAYEALTLADQASPLAGEDAERLAWTAALTGRDDDALALLERIYHQQLEAGAAMAAARAAFWLSFRLFSLGEAGRASGWHARAEKLVEREGDDCVVRGYLLVTGCYRRLVAGQHEAVGETADEVAALADRLDEADLYAFARSLQGRSLLGIGRREEGLARFDEVMLAAANGELSPLVTGLMYCTAIGCCQDVYALDRAREWTAALVEWCGAQPQLVAFSSRCLLHRAELLQIEGAWPEAIEEARRAGERRTRGDPDAAAGALYQQAEIHRLRGELATAEEDYRAASQLGMEPQPGLALLRLAQGDRAAAASAIRRVVAGTGDRLRRARFLPAAVEILLATGDREEAQRACAELEEIAELWQTDVVRAMAAHARGALDLAEGNARAVLEPVRRAFFVWQQLGAPYLAARLRVLLGRACLALGDRDGARLELAAARESFAQVGAAPDVAAVDALLAGPRKAAHGLTARELQVLRLVAQGKTNKAIAQELSLSEKTVDRHLSNIFTKVDVSSRAAATAYAYEHDLI